MVETWDANLEYYYAKEHELLNYWGELIRQQGSDILLECFYHDCKINHDGVVINTSKGDFSAKLLIDASGYNSPILRQYAIPDNYYWWSVSGCIAEFPNGLNDMQAGDYMLWGTFTDSNADLDASMEQGRPVLEYEILDEKTCFIFIFYLRKSKMAEDEMKEEFMHVLRKEDSTRNFHDVIIKEWKHGWYPSGGASSQKVAENRLAFIGDAGCWTSPCGWGMSYIVANYKHYARQLLPAIQADQLSKAQLKKLIKLKLHTRSQVLLDQIVTHFLSYASSTMLDQFIRLFEQGGPLGDQGPILCEKLFTLTMQEADIKFLLKHMAQFLDIKQLMHSMHVEDYQLLLELLGEYIEQGILKEVYQLSNILKKNQEKLAFQDGIALD